MISPSLSLSLSLRLSQPLSLAEKQQCQQKQHHSGFPPGPYLMKRPLNDEDWGQVLLNSYTAWIHHTLKPFVPLELEKIHLLGCLFDVKFMQGVWYHITGQSRKDNRGR